jgi:hypothetical protein
LTNGVATHFTIHTVRSTGKGSRTGTATARNAPLSTPKCASSIPFQNPSPPSPLPRERVARRPGEGRSGVAGAVVTLYLLGCVTAPAASRSRRAMTHWNEQPTLFELTTCDELPSSGGFPKKIPSPSLTPNADPSTPEGDVSSREPGVLKAISPWAGMPLHEVCAACGCEIQEKSRPDKSSCGFARAKLRPNNGSYQGKGGVSQLPLEVERRFSGLIR